MFWKKKEIILPKIQPKVSTLEEIAVLFDSPKAPYFRVFGDTLMLWYKKGFGQAKKDYKLPLHTNQICYISNVCKGKLIESGKWDIAKRTFEKEIVLALNRFWGKYET